jgi:hypothetical protein
MYTRKIMMSRPASIYILLFLLVSFTSCLSVKPLEFKKAENVTLTGTAADPQISFNITGRNPNNWSFKLKELQTIVTIDGQTFVNMQSDSVIRLKKDADFSIPASVKAPQGDLMKILSSGLSMFLSGNQIPLEIKGDFVLKKFLFRRKFSFEFNEKIDPKMLNGKF